MRRLRVGFVSLRGYGAKGNRHLRPLEDGTIEQLVRSAERELARAARGIRDTDKKILSFVEGSDAKTSAAGLRATCDFIPRLEDVPSFQQALLYLSRAMAEAAAALAAQWEDERYLRAEFAFDD